MYGLTFPYAEKIVLGICWLNQNLFDFTVLTHRRNIMDNMPFWKLFVNQNQLLYAQEMDKV